MEGVNDIGPYILAAHMLPQNLLNNVIFQVTFELPLCDKNINKTMQLRNQNWSDLMIVFK